MLAEEQCLLACEVAVPGMVVAVQCGVFAVGLAHILVAAEHCVLAEKCPQSSRAGDQCQQEIIVSFHCSPFHSIPLHGTLCEDQCST